MKDRFELVSKYQPQGDQPKAIEKLACERNSGGQEASDSAGCNRNWENIYGVQFD